MSNYDAPSLSLSEIRQSLHGMYPSKPKYTEKDYPSLDGKVVLITGGSHGVGYETAKSLAALTNAKIYIFARNEAKTLEAIERIQVEVSQEYGKSLINKIEFVQVDLADLTTIKRAVEKFLSMETRLDIIFLNAGLAYPPWGSRTPQGYLLQLGTNVLGHHLLQKLLDPIFIKTAKTNKPNESRLVWVSSSAHFTAPRGGFDFDSPNLVGEPRDQLAYAQSKALNAIQARYWPKVHQDNGIVSVSLCPGFYDTGFSKQVDFVKRFLIYLIAKPVRFSAYTLLYCGLSPEVTTANNGAHYLAYGELGALRKDIEDDENNAKIWKYLDDQVAPFI